jgi:alanine racemase
MIVDVIQRRRFGVISIVAVALLNACASPPKVRVDKDSHVDFASYKTFAWLEREAAPGAKNNPQQPKTLMSQRVRASVVAALQSKGYALRESDPDLRVSYELSVYERPKQSGMRLGIGAGGGSGNVAGGVGVSVPLGKRTEVVGSMTIDMIDAKRNAQVWTGTEEALVTSIDVSDTDVDRLVATILAKFP